MNFGCLIRKLALGIENHNAYLRWGEKLQEEGYTQHSIEVLVSNEPGTQKDFINNPQWAKRIYEDFTLVAKDLSLEIPDIQLDRSEEAETIRFIYNKLRESGLYLYSIDIRTREGISLNNDTETLLDSMAVNCGAKPLGELWFGVSKSVGEKALKEVLSRDVDFRSAYVGDVEAEKLADKFSSFFSDTVQYYSNWGSGLITNPGGSIPILDQDFLDYGLILLDENNIGMVVTVGST